MTDRLPHALTVDTEDWAALMCMYSGRPIPVSPQFGSSVAAVLDLLDRAGKRATFFVVAQHAAEEPSVVREIVARGHEVASHAWTHRPMAAFSEREFREDIRRSVGTLEDLTGGKVYGHRSPLFSLRPEHSWALEAMAEAGLEYDSSVFTSAWRRAGVTIPDHPFILRLPSGREIVEFPAPARKWGPMTVRFIGGRGARLAPASLFLRHLEEREQTGLPGMLYFHTYEMGSENLAQYVPRSVGRKRLAMQAAAWAFRVGGGRLQRLVRLLLERFEWAPMGEVIARLREEGRLPVFHLSQARGEDPKLWRTAKNGVLRRASRLRVFPFSLSSPPCRSPRPLGRKHVGCLVPPSAGWSPHMTTRSVLWAPLLALAAVALACVCCLAAENAAYVIGPGDALDVRIAGAPDLPSVTVTVRSDGAISVPHIGEVQVGGKTVRQVGELLTEALLKRYRQVDVTVNLTQFRERNVFVLGQVKTPGAVPLQGDSISVTQAILAAGGLTAEIADLDARLYGQGQAPVPVDLGKAMEAVAGDTALAAGDTLLIEARKPDEITLLGEVQKPGVYPLPRDARLDAILALGGTPTEAGDGRRAILVRDDGQTTIVDITHLLANPDSPANVPLTGIRLFVIPPKAEIVVGGEVKTPGTYPAGSQTKLFDILTAAGGLTEKADRQKVTVINRDGALVQVDAEQALAHPESAANIPVADVSIIVVGEDTRRYEVGVFGEVANPQSVPVREALPLAAALTQAGGLSEKADARKVQILRSDGKQETVDVTVLLGRRDATASAPDVAGVLVRPGDLVIVNRRYAEVLVLGAIAQQGARDFEEGDTVIDVIARSGGFGEKAAKQRTAILRRDGEKVQVIVADMKAALAGSEVLLQHPVQDGDIIYVPDRPKPAWKGLVQFLLGAGSFYQLILRR